MSRSRDAVQQLKSEVLSLEPWERLTLPQPLVMELLESWLESHGRREKGGRSSTGRRRVTQSTKRP